MDRLKIVFLDSYTLNPGDLDISSLQLLGEFVSYERTSREDLLARCRDANIIISNKVKLDKDILCQLPNLKMIQIAATGTNNVDLDFAKEKGIVVCNVSGYSTSSVAQHVFASLLAYLNRCETYFRETQNNAWSKKSDFSYWHDPIRELKDKTLGVLGFGKIGQAVAKIALAFEMKVIAVNKHAKTFSLSGVQNVSIDELLECSDVISLHTPLNDSTFEMINATTLNKMKPTTILVNTGRGQLINELELSIALKERAIEAALLDVLSVEPPASDHVLLSTPHCFITPHQAWTSQESRQRLLDGILQNIKGFQSGNLTNQVV